MKRYPKAVWDPLGPQTESRMGAHDIVCVHTMVGSLAGTDSYFEAGGYGGTESHFGTGGAGETPRQWQDLGYTADANLDGNWRVISIENADKGPGFPTWSGSAVPAFTSKQVDQLVDLVTWLCSRDAHTECSPTWACHKVGIPAAVIPDTRPGRRGIGYHRQGCTGNYPDGRVAGGEKWSESLGKICPGDKRIAQLRDDIVPRVAARLKPSPPGPPPPTGTQTQLSVAFANLGNARRESTVDDLTKLAKQAQVVVVAEASDRGEPITGFLRRHPRWVQYAGAGEPGQAAVRILYDRRVGRVERAESEPVCGPVRVGKAESLKGAGPALIKSKWVPRLHLVLPNERTVHILGAHLLPSATRTKHTLGAEEWTARRDLFTRHIGVLASTVAARKGVVIVAGDYNAEPSFELLAPLATAGLVGWTKEPTHGNRAIDHVLHRENRSVAVTGRRTVTTSSDHKAVVADYTL